MYRGEESSVQGFWGKSEGERPLDGKVILKWSFRKYYEAFEWIDVVPVTNKWLAFVNTVIKGIREFLE
jgi:hypothetical protein